MTRARDIADSTKTLSVDGGTIKLDGNYPVGTGHVALGDTALDTVTSSGNYNTALGASALTSNTSGDQNVAVGVSSLNNNSTGGNNVAVGLYAGRLNTTGGNNVALGMQALYSNTTANNNTAVGYQAGYNNTTGTENVAVGRSAMFDTSTGSYNTALGRSALASNTTGIDNTAVGYQAGYSNTTNSYNTYLGDHAGYSTTSTRNTFLGHGSGESITTGERNTILGRFSGNVGGLDIRTSSNNIVLSDGDGNVRVYVDNSGNVLIGKTSTGSTVEGMHIGTAKFTATRNAGPCAAFVRTGSDGSVVDIQNDGSTVGSISVSGSSTAYNTSSDYRLKENVVELTGATDRLKQLNPSRFNFIADADTTVDGFIAHEVQAVVPEAITGTHNEVDDDGNPVYQGIDQSKLVPLLVATIKELEARITALENA